MSIKPERLKAGDEIRIIAPARGLKLIGQDCRDIANKRFSELGLKVTFGKYTNDDEFNHEMSTSVEKRVSDLHDAFQDKNVKAIFTVIGGFNSNQILDYIDYDIIKNNPKIICGFSDISALVNAIYTKTGLITYLGTHYSSFGMDKGFDYSFEYFKKALMQNEEFEVKPSNEWSDDLWFLDQENRNFVKNEGYWTINKGKAEGEIIAGNLSVLTLLSGTQYFPDLTDKILFIEDCFMCDADYNLFEQQLESLSQQPNFDKVKAISIGRFQVKSNINQDKLKQIINNKTKLKNIPIIANVDFGHTTPMITIPIGGNARIEDDKIFIK
jgi:muramoyltetrapeptide carboxypeptidase LdcA involved in peptidoglycan recycling